MKRKRSTRVPLAAEYSEAQLGDRRLDSRLERLAELAARKPGASLPHVSGNDAELEGAYRFLSNSRVTCRAILAPHIRETVGRVGNGDNVVVAHDTTEFNFGSKPREDLGRVGQGKSFGFYGHFALAVNAADGRRPLGVLGLRMHRRHGGVGKRGHRKLASDPNNEGHRWLKLVEEVEQAVGPHVRPLHVMDREGDAYALMAALVGRGSRFVIRMAQDRRLILGQDKTERVCDALKRAPVLTHREVPITARGRSKMPSYRKNFPERNARLARLEVSTELVNLLRPDSAPRECPLTLNVGVVRVFEPSPPDGEPPIEWRLWTSEPTESATAALSVIDAYRCRWRIEEYFKALKSGCAIEQRQLESFRALANALCLYLPIAWRILLLRTLAREDATRPASSALNPVQLICLRAALRKLKRPPLGPHPTARSAWLGVAGLGGHITNNGDPGWIVLARGMDTLITIEAGYNLASIARKM